MIKLPKRGIHSCLTGWSTSIPSLQPGWGCPQDVTLGGADFQAVKTGIAAGTVANRDSTAEPESLSGAAVNALPATDAGIGGDGELDGWGQGGHGKRFSLRKMPGIVPDSLLTLP